VGRHEAAGQPPVTDQQVQQQLAAERPQVDAYRDQVVGRQVVNTVVAAFSEELGTSPAEVAAAQAAQAAPPVGAGGGYRFSPEEIELQLRKCDELIHGLRQEELPQAERIAGARPPAPDTVASVPQAEAVAERGRRLAQRIKNQIAFLENWQAQLRAVRQTYLDQEGNTVASWKSLSGGLFT
jgi:hypothetical protein